MLWNCCAMYCSTPWPTESSVITAPTPMTMPSMVRAVRSLLDESPRKAMRMDDVKFMYQMPNTQYPIPSTQSLYRALLPLLSRSRMLLPKTSLLSPT